MTHAFINLQILMSGFVKFILFMVIAVGIALGCLWFLGGKKQEYSTAISINALPEQVFPYLVEPLRVKKWNSRVDDIQPLTDGPVQLGSKSQSTLQFNGEPRVFQDEVIRFQQDEIFTVRSRAPNTILSSLFKLENESGKTGLSYQIKLTTKGFSRLLVPFQNSKRRQQEMAQDTLALKKIVESEIAVMSFDVSGGSSDEPDNQQQPTGDTPTGGEPQGSSPSDQQ